MIPVEEADSRNRVVSVGLIHLRHLAGVQVAEDGPTDAAPIRCESAEVKITAAPKRLLGAELGRPVKLTKEFVVRALDLHRETTVARQSHASLEVCPAGFRSAAARKTDSGPRACPEK